MTNLIFASFVAFVFYVIIPLAGAFSVRYRWRCFRRQIQQTTILKEVSYSEPERNESGAAGEYSFTGELQAIQEDSTIWVNNGKTSVRAEMKGLKLYLLPTNRFMENEGQVEENKALLPQDMPKRISWERVYSLTQGTGIMLSGTVFVENGTPVFRNSEEQPLLAIIFDGKKESILRRSIWSGRQLNEYWNTLTPWALITGSFFLFVLAYISLRSGVSNSVELLLIIMSIIPVILFLPPGVILYVLYRRLWRNGRYLRGERDLMKVLTDYPEFEEFETGSQAIKKYPDLKIRSCGIFNEELLSLMPCRVYCSCNIDEDFRPVHFYENLIVPGDPFELAEKCRSRARLMEVLAVASVGAGFLINSLLLYFGLLFFS